jgi:hypothetical protein
MRSSLCPDRCHFLELRPPGDHPAQHVPELGVRPGADLAGVARLDVGDDLVAETELIQPALGGKDQLRAAVRGVRAALHIAQLLELVDDPPDDLLVAAREARQLRRPDAVLVQEGENGAVAGVEVVIARLGEPGEELVLEGEEQSARQYAEIRVPFLPLLTPARGGRKIRRYQNGMI